MSHIFSPFFGFSSVSVTTGELDSACISNCMSKRHDTSLGGLWISYYYYDSENDQIHDSCNADFTVL